MGGAASLVPLLQTLFQPLPFEKEQAKVLFGFGEGGEWAKDGSRAVSLRLLLLLMVLALLVCFARAR